MDSTWATVIFWAIMAGGFIVWLCSLSVALRLGTTPIRSSSPTADFEPKSWAGTEFGSRTVQGTPAKLSKALARALTQLNVGGFTSLYEIVDRTDQNLVVRKTGPLVCNQPSGLYFSEAKIAFDYLGNGTTRVSYELGYDRLAKRMRSIALGIIFLIGLPVMLIVGGAVWHFVLSSTNPNTRWQVLQTLQITHALWPPFIFIAVYALGRRSQRRTFRTC